MANAEIKTGQGSEMTRGSLGDPERAFWSGRIPELDGLRGLAIGLVLLCHYVANQLDTQPGTALHYLHIALGYCWSGVDLFFVLSGFLIGGILIDHRDSANYFKTFYVRRTCRIFPIYYLWLLMTGMLLALRLPEHLRQVMEPQLPFWSYFTYTQNLLALKPGEFGPGWFSPTWSLAVEEQFYVLFPLVIRFCPRAALPWWLGVLALSAVVFRMLVFFLLPSPGFTGFVLLPCRWDSLCLGALVAWLVRKPGFIEDVKRHERVVLGGSGLILIILIGLRVGRQGTLYSFGMHLLGLSLLAALYAGLLLLALYSHRKWIKTFFRNSWLRKLGGISYCVYLLHQPVVFLCHSLLWKQPPKLTSGPRALTTALALGLTLGMASLSWRYFESKVIVWGRRFTY